MAAVVDVATLEAQVIEAAVVIYEPTTPPVVRKTAQKFLEGIEKSDQSWEVTNRILTNVQLPISTRQLAAVIMKNKARFGATSFPPNVIDMILNLIALYADGPKIVITPLYACLINTFFHIPDGTLLFDATIAKLSSVLLKNPSDFVRFLRLIPEEVTASRGASASISILRHATPRVIPWLQQYVQSYGVAAAGEPALFECLDSWSNELELSELVKTGMIDTIYNGVLNPASFSAAINCLCSIYDSNGISPENQADIYEFYRRTVALQPKIAVVAANEDESEFVELTKLFAIAGESWCPLIIDQPDQFRPLIVCLLECVRLDVRRKAVHHTFYFWQKLSNMIADADAGSHFGQEFSSLFELMIERVQYPAGEAGNGLDPFDGDREEEDLFRESRHEIGDVLKDCCLIIDSSDCLDRLRFLIEQHRAGGPTSWYKLEALLFSVRAIGRMVPPDCRSFSAVLITILNIDSTSNQKLLFQVIMVISRYTIWSTHHPDLLRPQLDYILPAFESPIEEIRNAAASAFRYFGLDCGKHLTGLVDTIQPFYVSSLDKLSLSGQMYLTEGVAAIISALPVEEVQPTLAKFCGPIVERVIAVSQQSDPGAVKAMANTISLVSVFIDVLHPRNGDETAVEKTVLPYWQLVMKAISEAGRAHWGNTAVVENMCVCWRMLIFGVRKRIVPMLDFMLNELLTGFSKTHDARFLWVSTTVLSTFREGDDDSTVTAGVFKFYELMMNAYVQLDRSDPNKLVDEIDDAYRLSMAALIYHPISFFSSAVLASVVTAAVEIIGHDNKLHPAPLTSTFRFMRCFLTYGVSNGASQHVCPVDTPAARQAEVAQHIIARVKAIVGEIGFRLTVALLIRLIRLNPYDGVSDGVDLLQGIFEVEPSSTIDCVGRLLTDASIVEPTIQASVETGRLRSVLAEFQAQVSNGVSYPARGLSQEFIMWHGWLHPGDEE